MPVVPGIPEGQQPYTLASVMPPVPKRSASPISIVFLVIGIVTFLCGAVLGIVGLGGSSSTPQTVSSPSPVYIYVTAPAVAATTTPPTASAPTKPPPAPAPTITDGVWTVGLDFPAGKYRTTEAVGGDCYWAITKSGTNGEDIIANDIPGGGRPIVTLKNGQDFNSARCGTWAKIG